MYVERRRRYPFRPTLSAGGASNMSGTARLLRCAGLLLGGALLSGAWAQGVDEPSMAIQLVDLGQQALTQGSNRAAEGFFKKALELDPANQPAADGLKEIKRSDKALL